MDARKTWLKHLANSRSVRKWAQACDAALFAGTVRVQTRNTTYLFRNGSCFGITHEGRERSTSSGFVGMKLAGWLISDQSQIYLSREWRPGVCAVLWGTDRNGRLPFALTSPTRRFAQFGGAPVERRLRAVVERHADPTLTRINLPMGSAGLHSSVRPVVPAI